MPSTSELLTPFRVALSFALPLMLALLVLQIVLRRVKRVRRTSRRDKGGGLSPSEWRIDHAAEQVRAEEASSYERKPLLNREGAGRS